MALPDGVGAQKFTAKIQMLTTIHYVNGDIQTYLRKSTTIYQISNYLINLKDMSEVKL